MKRFLLLLLPLTAQATDYGDDVRQDVDVANAASANTVVDMANENVATGGQAFASANEVSVEGDRHDSFALGLSNGLGDVDINDCMASSQWNTPLVGRQKVSLNPWCASMYYDQVGLYEQAGYLRCQIPEIRARYKKGKQFRESACIDANTIKVPHGTSTESNSQLDSRLKKLAENFNEIRQIKVDLEASLSAANERIANLEKEAKAEERRRRAPAQPKQVIQQVPFLSEDKKKALAAIRGDE